MSENVSDEALGISESGSSYKSSIQVPPLTGVPAEGVDEGVVPPELQAARIRNSTERAAKDNLR